MGILGNNGLLLLIISFTFIVPIMLAICIICCSDRRLTYNTIHTSVDVLLYVDFTIYVTIYVTICICICIYIYIYVYIYICIYIYIIM